MSGNHVMQFDSTLPPSSDKPAINNAPPPLAAAPTGESRPSQMMATLLSLFLALFLADAIVSLVDDSLILFFNVKALTIFRGILFFFALAMAVVIYVMMGLTPIVPKRWFLPITLFTPVAGLFVIPFMIYFFAQWQQVTWAVSFCQVVLGLTVLYWAQGGMKFRWPLVATNQLGTQRFSWRNLSVFTLVNLFVLLPAVVIYLGFCLALATDHFSAGFLALRPDGLTVKVRTYLREDGKTIQLVPMAHVGDSTFYRKLSRSFPTNAIVLMEGVTDEKNLLTNKISYERMATSLGLAEQQVEFQPQGEMVQADLDVAQFSTNTIDLLNLIMLFHAKGVNDETLLKLTEYSPPLNFEKELFHDLLTKRNRHLLKEIHIWLSQAEDIIIPWGAAHIPEIAKEIQNAGFRLKETREFTVIQFGSGKGDDKSSVEVPDHERR